jgi:hypothetical protein
MIRTGPFGAVAMAAHRTSLAYLATLGAVLAATACGSGGSSGYDAGVRSRFISACTQASSGHTTACEAAYDCIRQRVSFADFKAADAAIREGRPVDPKVAPVLGQCAAQSAHG